MAGAQNSKDSLFSICFEFLYSHYVNSFLTFESIKIILARENQFKYAEGLYIVQKYIGVLYPPESEKAGLIVRGSKHEKDIPR